MVVRLHLTQQPVDVAVRRGHVAGGFGCIVFNTLDGALQFAYVLLDRLGRIDINQLVQNAVRLRQKPNPNFLEKTRHNSVLLNITLVIHTYNRKLMFGRMNRHLYPVFSHVSSNRAARTAFFDGWRLRTGGQRGRGPNSVSASLGLSPSL